MDEAGRLAERYRDDAVAMAGATGDLVQRAAMYHHLYEHSGGNHGFPLLAAHGALWASGYFRHGLRFARVAAMVQGACGGRPAEENIAAVARFAESFRDINRRVCVETLHVYWLTGDPRCRTIADTMVPDALRSQMDRCHWARLQGRRLGEEERRALFEAFFRWEQATIVGPAVDAAFAAFDWPFIRALALRPTVRFAYFGFRGLPFANFSDSAERIAKGLLAFERAERAGWSQVESALQRYGLMPEAFFRDPGAFVDRHRPRPVWTGIASA